MPAGHVRERLVECLVVEEPLDQGVVGLGPVDDDPFQVLVEDLAELVDVIDQPGLGDSGVLGDRDDLLDGPYLVGGAQV